MHLTIADGKKIAMPRYYKDKLYTHDERSQIAGYQKGQIEQRMYDEISKIPEHELTQRIRDHKQAIEASWQRMYKQALQSRNKI